jgi:hypothetical protein
MPIKHPVDGEPLYSVGEASDWLTERGLPMSVPSLNSGRTNGNGPRFLPIGKRRWYRESAMLEFLLSKIGHEVSSTSEMKAENHLMIEDKSAARPNGGGEPEAEDTTSRARRSRRSRWEITPPRVKE